MIADYCKRQALSQCGYKFDPENLSQFEAEYLTEIHSEFNRLKVKDLKAANKAGGSKRGK